MNQFVQRVANYIANEVLIKGLANSKTFQRFAVRTDKHLQEMQKQGVESFEEMTKRAASTISEAEASSGAAASSGSGGGVPPVPPPRGFYGFARAFAHEVRNDFGGGAAK